MEEMKTIIKRIEDHFIGFLRSVSSLFPVDRNENRESTQYMISVTGLG